MFRFKLIIFLILFFISFRSFGIGRVEGNNISFFVSSFFSLFGKSKNNIVSSDDADSWAEFTPEENNQIGKYLITNKIGSDMNSCLKVSKSENILDRVDVDSTNFMLSRNVATPSVSEEKEDTFRNDMHRLDEIQRNGKNVTETIKPKNEEVYNAWLAEDPDVTRMHQGIFADNLGIVNIALEQAKANEVINSGRKLEIDRRSIFNFRESEKKCDVTDTSSIREQYKGIVDGENIDLGKTELGELQYKGTFDYEKGIPLFANISIQKPVERKFVFNPEVMKSLKRKHDELTSKSIKPISFEKKMFEDRNKKRIR